MGRELPNTMQDLIQDMLVWLATFFGVSLALICAVRWGLKRVRQRRLERLKEIETRCRVVPDELGLPLFWKTSPKSLETFDYRVGRMLQWSLPAGCLAAGAMWSMIGQDGWNWNGGACGVLAAFVSLLVLTVWMNWRRETTMPRQSRQLALALRCWAIRISAGVECRLALEQTAKQLRRLDPEIARHLAAGAANPDGDLLQRAFHPCGSGVAERLADIVAGRTSDEPQVLLLRQYRYAAGGYIYEIPAGRLDGDETPAECAVRELKEETGCTAERLEPLVTMFTTPGFTDEVIHLFMATGLTHGETAREADEFADLVMMRLSEALDLIRSGDILDAKTVLGLLYAAGFKTG